MARIAIMSIGMYGHLAPLTRVAGALSQAGHTLLAWTPPQYRSEVEAAGGRVVPWEPCPIPTGPWSLLDLAAGLADATERCTEELLDQLLSEGIELVVHDVHVPWARVAADFLGLPRIMTTPLFPDPATAGDVPVGTPVGDGAVASVERSREAIGRRWGVDLGGWSGALYNSAPTTVFLTTQQVAGVRQAREGWHFVGPLLRPGRAPSGNDDRRLVYVSFGTFIALNPQLLQAVVDALADEPLRVLLSTGRTARPLADLGPLPANVQVRDFVSAPDVLARADAFITHAGSGSIHEALLAGTPMVCIPHFVDQFDWSRRIQELGAGVAAEVHPTSIRAAVRELLGDGSYRRRAAAIGGDLAIVDGAERVAALAARCLADDESGTGGSWSAR